MRPIAILCGDIHLSLKPPVFRSGEPDWFMSMARSLKQMRLHAEGRGLPILCAGDIFDKWNGPVEVVNFALEYLPKMYAIPGQHDLPYHRFEDVGKSAFGVLVKAGKIQMLKPMPLKVYGDGGFFWVSGFPWNADLVSVKGTPNEGAIAIIHKYIWLKDSHKHPQASSDSNWLNIKKQLSGYDLVVSGDNHKGFYSKKHRIFNCGTFFRRKADEVDYEPRYGVLYSDGSVESFGFDTSLDVYTKDEATASPATDLSVDFVTEFESLGSDPLDFKLHLDRALDGEDDLVKAAVMQIGEQEVDV